MTARTPPRRAELTLSTGLLVQPEAPLDTRSLYVRATTCNLGKRAAAPPWPPPPSFPPPHAPSSPLPLLLPSLSPCLLPSQRLRVTGPLPAQQRGRHLLGRLGCRWSGGVLASAVRPPLGTRHSTALPRLPAALTGKQPVREDQQYPSHPRAQKGRGAVRGGVGRGSLSQREGGGASTAGLVLVSVHAPPL